MWIDYVRVARRGWRELLFSAMLLGLSSFGQTFFVSLYGDAIRGDFNLTSGTFGTIYAISTVGGAIALSYLGRLIDRVSISTYAAAASLLLSSACLALLFANTLPLLVLAFFALRLGGQGLMVHSSMTAAARFFPRDTGKAVGLVSLGFCIAQALLPAYAVLSATSVGWRMSWGLNAILVIAGCTLALWILPLSRRQEISATERTARNPLVNKGSSPFRDIRFFCAVPAVFASPFLMNGFLFHQAHLADEKHWQLSWLAAWFIAYAVTQGSVFIAAGSLIDRFKSSRILPLFLIPQAIGFLLLFAYSSPWIIPFYLVLTGISSACASTLSTSLWVELFGSNRFGEVRAVAEAGNVLATGASPILVGMLIDAGISMSAQAGCAVLIILSASILSLGVRR